MRRKMAMVMAAAMAVGMMAAGCSGKQAEPEVTEAAKEETTKGTEGAKETKGAEASEGQTGQAGMDGKDIKIGVTLPSSMTVP